MLFFIKIPLILAENFLFKMLPSIRPIVEKSFFNPYYFSDSHIAYSKAQFQKFVDKIGGKAAVLKGKILLELGPGGSIGFGLLALEKGLLRYIAIDSESHMTIDPKIVNSYKKLYNNRNSSISRFITRKGDGYFHNPQKIIFKTIGQSSTYGLKPETVDYIYSCAVLEHVHNLDECFSQMHHVLKKGGIMNHEVDLRDHIFNQQKLFFLKINEKLFKLLFGSSGTYVNRRRFSYYLKLFKRYRLKVISLEQRTKKYDAKTVKIYSKKFRLEDINTQTFNVTLLKL